MCCVVLFCFPKNRKNHTFITKVTCLKIANFNSVLQSIEKIVFLNRTIVKMSLLFSLSNELYYSLISFSKMVKFSVLNGNRQCNGNSLLLLSLTLLLLETAEFALLQIFATRAKHT